MARKKIRVDWEENNNVINKYYNYISSVGRALGGIIYRELRREASFIVDQYYKDYTPVSYKRHIERGFPESGYKRALFDRFYAPGGWLHKRKMTIEVGWVTDNMYDDYGFAGEDDDKETFGGLSNKEAVLKSFIEGYHGDSSFDIKSSWYPELLFNYVNYLLDKSSVDLMVVEAVRVANARNIF